MSYEYTDHTGFHLLVREGVKDHIYIDTEAPDRTFQGVLVKREDAPAVALAILDAAGVEPIDPDIPGASAAPDSLALYWLYQWAGLRKATAEREAEDAKVDEYRTLIMSAIDIVAPAWSGLTDDSKDGWRKKYRAAREFFTREHENGWQDKMAPPIGDLDCIASTDEIIAVLEDKPAPRVLNYGEG